MKERQQLLGQLSKALFICFRILVYLTVEFLNGCYKGEWAQGTMQFSYQPAAPKTQ